MIEPADGSTRVGRLTRVLRTSLAGDTAWSFGAEAIRMVGGLAVFFVLVRALGTDGLRGELTLIRAARAVAALDGDAAVADRHLALVAAPALRHRLRRNPLDDAGSSVRVERAVAEMFGA